MAKKIRFPLEMDNGVEVRSIEELRVNFSLARVLEYFESGKLMIWLRDRYANDIADAIEAIDPSEQELAKKISEIFDVPYNEKIQKELEKAAEKEERIKRLKQFTENKRFLDNIDYVAFEQDELYDLLDEDAKVIYLCGDRFSIPLAKQGVNYIGINNPIVVVDSKVEVDWDKKKISVEGVTFDEKYQAIVDNVRITEKELDERCTKIELTQDVADSTNITKEEVHGKSVEMVKPNAKKLVRIGEYSRTYLKFFSQFEKIDMEKMYNMAKTELEKLDCNINDKSSEQENENAINLVKIGEYSGKAHLDLISSDDERDIRGIFDIAKVELEVFNYDITKTWN